MKLSASDIAQLAAAAGFSGGDLPTAVAVALAESTGGDPRAFNPEGSYGLWQIYLRDHPEFVSWNLYDPATNATAAFRVYRNAGYNFRPWSAFKNGAYQRYLPGSQAAVSALMNAEANAVEIAPGVTVLSPQEDLGANPSAGGFGVAAGQIPQLPGWVWIAAATLGLVVWMQD